MFNKIYGDMLYLFWDSNKKDIYIIPTIIWTGPEWGDKMTILKIKWLKLIIYFNFTSRKDDE